MKKILFSLLAGATMLLGSCSKESVDNLAPSGTETTFTVSMAELQTRATSTVTPTRYIMEVWSADGSVAENVIKKADGTMVSHLELSSGSFTALLDKTKAYTCLFWADGSAADNNNGVYNAASLKAVTLNTGKAATEAYYAKVVVAKGTNPAVAVTLKRAVAKVTLFETATVEAGKNIVVTYPNNTVFNALDGTVGTPTTGYKTTITTATGKLTGALGEFYMLSPAGGEAINLSIQYASEPIKSLTNVPVKQNFNTNIKGEFSNLLSKTFTVTADDAWGTPDNEVDLRWEKAMQFTINFTNATDKTYIIPFVETGTTPCDLVIEWGDGESKSIPNGTDLSTQATADLLKHTYTALAAEYQITITTVAPATQQQIPAFKPGKYRTDSNNNNNSKLKSMDNPMLNTASTDFSECFNFCGKLSSIPADLFAKNTAATNFEMCFYSCKKLTSIPAELFAKNTAVTNFKQCFMACDMAMLNANIFCNESSTTKATRFLNKTVDFSYCFQECGYSISTGNGGTAPALWDYNFGTGAATKTQCFMSATKVTNYSQIPKAWGGPLE